MKLGSRASIAGTPLGLLLASAMLVAGPLAAQQAPAPSAAPAVPSTASQRQAAAVLKSMAEYLVTLQSFKVTTSNGYETVQANGQKVEFGETRRISVARPDRLRIEEESSDGINDLTLFDGKQITAVSADFNVYAQAPQPPSLEDALVYFVRDLRMRAPLALLLSTHISTEIPALGKDVEYVETTMIRGQEAHHVAGRSESVDFEFWVADDDKKPLPLRVAMTYKTAPGQPRFWADLSEWKPKARLSSSTFKLSLPEGAQKIPFAVQLSALGAAAPQAAASGGVTP